MNNALPSSFSLSPPLTHSLRSQSTATCSIDEDCYTGVCKPAGANEKVRYCQTSRATKYVVKCLNDKLEGLDKAKAMMKVRNCLVAQLLDGNALIQYVIQMRE